FKVHIKKSGHLINMNYLFLKECVEQSPVAPFQQQWLDAMLARVPHRLRQGPGRQELLEDICKEVSETYLRVMTKHRGEILDFSCPWHDSFVQSRKEMQKNLHILHPVMKNVLDICYSTFSHLLLIDLSDCRYCRPVDCESLKNKVAVECKRVEDRLMKSWFPKVIHLLTSKDTVQKVKPKKLDSFYNCASMLLSNQLKALVERSVVAFVSLFDPLNISKLPLFKMDLIFDDEKMDFYPNFRDLEEAVLEIANLISNTMQRVQTVQAWLAEGNISVVDAKLPDHVQMWAQTTLRNAVRINLDGPAKHFQSYVDSYDWLVDGTAQSQVETLMEEEHSFDEYTKQVERFRALSQEISGLPSLIHFDMVQLDCEELKQGLANKANTLSEIIVGKICKEFEGIRDRALKVPETTEDMMEMITYTGQVKTKGIEELNNRITEAQHRMNYLMDVHIFDAEHLELNATVLLWPQNIYPIFDQSDEVMEEAKQKGQQELQVRREKLLLELEKVGRRMEEFAQCSELDMMQQYASDVRTVQKRIQDTEESIVFINKEEALYKWDQTSYPEVEVIKESIEPYQKLFNLVLKWQRTRKRWMDGSFLDLNGESIELEVEEYFREIYKMQKFFQQKQNKAEQEKEKIAGLKSKPKEEEDKQESATILICTSVVEQVKEFKVVFTSY
uniref:Dynein heavy chain linker domain-containing protein n=1 Tax=Sinocyclocheilus anshuiensis TaxID=1608454 RepID=A0A671QGA3_9TELE